MPSSTVEDYLKVIYSQQQHAGGDLAPMGQIAIAMKVAPGTATAMVKTLADAGLVDYEPRGGVRLSGKGEKLALHVLRRHRLVEQFLVQVLHLDWSEVDAEAEELEHAISDKVLDRIDALLKHPEFDPHGDPIPTARGKLPRRSMTSLAECEIKRAMRVARISDQDPQFLQFIDRSHLKPGAELIVLSREPVGDSISVQPHNRPIVTLGTTAAQKILVEEI